MSKYRMAIINDRDEVVTEPQIVEADSIEEARELYWDLVIGFELVADRVDKDASSDFGIEDSDDFDDGSDPDEEELVVKVPDYIAERIKSVQDLEDYYAFIEEQNGSNVTYDFSEKHLGRIEELMSDMNYAPGYYNAENVKRIITGK